MALAWKQLPWAEVGRLEAEREGGRERKGGRKNVRDRENERDRNKQKDGEDERYRDKGERQRRE